MQAIDGIKLFQMNAADVYAAETEAEALECMRELLSCESLDELRADYLQDGPVVELDDDDLERKITIEDDGPDQNETRTLTFREHLQELIDSGEEFPAFFSSTEY